MAKGWELTCVLIAILIAAAGTAWSQTEEVHGEASGWITSDPRHSAVSQVGLRYIPDLLASMRLSGDFDLNMELSLNALAAGDFDRERPPSYDRTLKLYRAWVRVSTERFEARIGLQKLSFGPGMLFRPLMWFDRIDPRDPLQLTDGVYGLLLRYYFQDNANIWLWGLYGNDDTKGWELEPTVKKTVEYGGRVQTPLWTGEIGATYHHRRADQPVLTSLPMTVASEVPEDRFALDGKWDVGIGLWFEAAVIRQETTIPGMKYQRLWTIGGDYTFGIGSGLYVATEYFRIDNAADPFGTAAGSGFSGLSMSYPVGIVDQVSAIVYRDWRNREWYRILTWQRKYDDWIFYLLGFWNPETVRIYGNQSGSNAFAGTGFQFMVVFNH